MGGTSSQATTQNSTTAPWAPAQGTLQGILGQLNGQLGNTGTTGAENSALGTIENQYAPQIGNFTNSLLSGGGAMNQAGNVNQNYQNYQAQTNPLASNTNYDPMQTPGLSDSLNYLRNSVGTDINGQFAAAGRDMSPANSQAYGYGVTGALAPILTNQYNQNVQNQQGAAQNLYNAGNTNAGILSGMQQQQLANQGQGAQQALPQNDPTLQAEAQRRGIPVQALGMLANIGVPIAGLGSQNSGTSNTTKQDSGMQQFAQFGQGIGGILGNFGAGKAFPKIF